MDGFAELLTRLVVGQGVRANEVHCRKAIELPGYFRPTMKWDMLIVTGGALVAAVEMKSQVGPSFGNNFNNRTEEAIGSAQDLWTAYREHAFADSPAPFLGYVFVLEDCDGARRPVGVEEPHFRVFPEFVGASYMRRYELFCRKLVLERLYTAAAFITTPSALGPAGAYDTPADDLSFVQFARGLLSHVSRFV